MKTAENVMHDAYNEKKNLQSSRFALIVASLALACVFDDDECAMLFI